MSIDVEFSPGAQELMRTTGVTADEVVTTVNDRDKGILNPGVSCLVAVHWFSPERLVYVDSKITQKEFEPEKKRVQIRRVQVMLAIELFPDLPAGSVERSMELEPLALIVAESFGLKVTCHPDARPVWVYSGPWDGQQITVERPRGAADLLVLATLNDEKGTAFGAWAFDVARYVEWHRRRKDWH